MWFNSKGAGIRLVPAANCRSGEVHVRN
jgi:hypothetical protein